ncbi:MAG: DNA polymerase III subunit gamma/tau [Oscillospiraceae bacterium]
MYQVLYRKWRPQAFSDVVGQEQVTKVLMGAVMSGRLSHAYLFTGSRGTGKTSCAKILAKAVNCEHTINGNPCNECEICKGIDSGAILDVIEIDAASNNGVDNIRDLRDEANYTPTTAKYRVYIIDEVHMLSMGAFNALLKTLEEPPEHVKFILATTEVHKLPSTILSRCQRFDFKRISPEDIAKRLLYVAENEKMDLTKEAAMLIARVADGALRDALSLLDRCSSFGETITEKVASDAAGIAGREYLFTLVDAIEKNDSAKALETVGMLYNNSCDMERLINELISQFRNMMISISVPNYKELIICPEADIIKIREQAESLTLEAILKGLDVLNSSLSDLKRGANRRTTVEMSVIRLCNPQLDTDVNALLKRISELERTVKGFLNGVAVKQISITEEKSEPEPVKVKADTKEKPIAPLKEQEEINVLDDNPPIAEKSVETPHKEVEKSEPLKGDELFEPWCDVIEMLNETDKPIVGLLYNSSAFIHGEYLLIKSDNATLAQFLRTGNHSALITKAVLDVTGKKYRLGIYNSQQAQQAPKKDPLEDLMNKARGLGVNIVEQ